MNNADTRRFERLYIPEPNSGCWIWLGSTNGKADYGKFWYRGRKIYAHHFSWALTGRERPPHLHLLHKCDLPCCVNPEHLFLGTDLDNTVDRVRKGRTCGRGRSRASKLPYGVTRNGKSGFAASLSTGGRNVYLGTFRTPEEAHAVACAERDRVYGFRARAGTLE